MVKRIIATVQSTFAVRPSHRVLILVSRHPELGYVFIETASKKPLIIKLNERIVPTVRALLQPIFPAITTSDIHAYKFFETNSIGYQLVCFDWPPMPELMFRPGRLKIKGWKLTPISQHEQYQKIAHRIGLSENSLAAIAAS